MKTAPSVKIGAVGAGGDAEAIRVLVDRLRRLPKTAKKPIVSMNAFVPVYSESSAFWFPANAAAEQLVQLKHVLDDIQKLNTIRLRLDSSDNTGNTLLAKYMLIELVSASDIFGRLKKSVFNAPKLVKGSNPPLRYVTKSELATAKSAAKQFHADFGPRQKQLTDIRNNIAAHRADADPIFKFQELWGQIDLSTICTLCNHLIVFFESVKTLNIYEWSGCEEGAFTMISQRIAHPWHDAFDSVEGDGGDMAE